MKTKVYIETTIPSYLVARPSRDLLIAAHQQITRDWWELRGPAFDLYVSEPVLEEAAAGDATPAGKRLELLADIRVLPLTEGILKLAESLVAEKVRSHAKPLVMRFTSRSLRLTLVSTC